MNGYEARRAAKAERFRRYAENAAKRAESADAGARRIMDLIPLGQPILIGHHSERHARRDRDRIDAGFRRAREESDRAATNARRAAAVENDHAISSWDPDARAKIEARIAELEAKQARMRERNAAARKAKTEAPHEGWELSNNNGNIRRLRERLVALDRQAAAAPGWLKVVPNKWPGRCEECGAAVEARAGFYASDTDGNAGVRCAGCMNDGGGNDGN